jgi:hypothetical protein
MLLLTIKHFFFREISKNRGQYDAIDNAGKQTRIHKTIGGRSPVKQRVEKTLKCERSMEVWCCAAGFQKKVCFQHCTAIRLLIDTVRLTRLLQVFTLSCRVNFYLSLFELTSLIGGV